MNITDDIIFWKTAGSGIKTIRLKDSLHFDIRSVLFKTVSLVHCLKRKEGCKNQLIDVWWRDSKKYFTALYPKHTIPIVSQKHRLVQ